jgi:flagellar hook-associated protein 2
MSITFSGLASGLDTSAIIDALMQVARQPVTRLQSKRSSYTSKASKLSDLRTRLASLRTSALSLDTAAELRSYTAQSSDTAKLTAAASSSAAPGSYSINVKQLASAQRSYSGGVAEKDQTGVVGYGQLAIRVAGGSWTTVEIDQDTDTLEGVAAKINGAVSGVTASVVKVSDSEYRLLVAGKQTGAANTIEFDLTASGKGLDDQLGLNAAHTPEQAAQDAWLLMDGKNFYRATNQSADAIAGVTLNLSGTSDPSSVTVTVATDLDAVVSKVQSTINSYNSTLSFIKEQFTYSGTVKADSLMGDSAVLTVKNQLQSVIGGEVAAAGTTYNALAKIGVSTARDGTLSLDTTTLKAALAADPDAVTDLFTYSDGDVGTDNDGVTVRLVRTIDQLLQSETGIISARDEGIQDTISSIDDRIAGLERSLSTYEAGLRKQFTALETLLSSLQKQSSYLTAAQ